MYLSIESRIAKRASAMRAASTVKCSCGAVEFGGPHTPSCAYKLMVEAAYVTAKEEVWDDLTEEERETCS